MKKNMGNADRIVRLVIAAVVGILWVTGVVQGALAIGLMAVAGIFVATSAISFCPLYSIFGIKTCPLEGSKK